MQAQECFPKYWLSRMTSDKSVVWFPPRDSKQWGGGGGGGGGAQWFIASCSRLLIRGSWVRVPIDKVSCPQLSLSTQAYSFTCSKR